MVRVAAIALAFTWFGVLADAGAATRTWSGASGTGWNTPGNWIEGIVPADGDDLVFPDSPTNRDSNNDIAGLDIASVSVTTANTGADYNFTGNGITLGGPITFANPGAGSNNPHWQIPLTLSASVTLTSSGRLTFVEGAIALGANTLTAQATNDLRISGAISGTGGVTKTGGSPLTLAGASTYGGPTQVNGGMLVAGSPGALGGNATGTTFANGTTLRLSFGPYTLAEPLTFSGPAGTVSMIENIELSGPIAFNGTLNYQATSAGSISGPISSAGTLVITGPDALSTSGNSPAFTGTVSIQSGSFIPQGTFPAAITLQAPGSLFGTATSGLLTMTGGTFAPGIVQQFFAPAGLASSGGMHNLVMVPGLPVTNYDQIQVTGPVSLGGTTLNPTSAGVLPLGLTFVIILNDGADPVVGEYVGKPEGATFLQFGNWFSITYAGGDGNDVVLTTVAEPVQVPQTPVPGPGPLALALASLAILGIAIRRFSRRS
jgi:autotransporter-associated beta strand protein